LNVQSLVSIHLSVSPGDAGCSPVVLKLHQHQLNVAASTSCSELKEQPEQVLDRASIVTDLGGSSAGVGQRESWDRLRCES